MLSNDGFFQVLLSEVKNLGLRTRSQIFHEEQNTKTIRQIRLTLSPFKQKVYKLEPLNTSA
jgi:hypothetical protein